MKKIFYSDSPEQTCAVGAHLARKLKEKMAGELPGADMFIALYGPLGMGKTVFVRGMISALIPEAVPLVHSPTYALVNEYTGGGMTVYHFDMYRISSEDELEAIGFYELAQRGLTLCEWCENIPYAIPENAVNVTIEATGENERKITVRTTDE